MSLELFGLTKRYAPDRPLAVDGVRLSVGDGEVLGLVGPSGCGKSTLLMLVAGLEIPDAGEVWWRGQDLAAVPPHRRGFGLVFQDYALFPHLDVAGNVGFGLAMQGAAQRVIAPKVQWALDLVGLAGFEHRDVNRLSGGEQQRVALARTLAPGPPLVLLDEPLGALDRLLRERLLEVLAAELRAAGQTALYVTHDQEEAFSIADRVAVMRAGRVEQLGTPAAVYAQPANRWVAEFLGFHNLLSATLVHDDDGRWAVTSAGRFALVEEGRLFESGTASRPESAAPGPKGTEATLLIRPEGARIAHGDAADIRGTVLDVAFRGSRQVVDLSAGGARLRFEFPAGEKLPAPGSPLHLDLPVAALQLVESPAG